MGYIIIKKKLRQEYKKKLITIYIYIYQLTVKFFLQQLSLPVTKRTRSTFFSYWHPKRDVAMYLCLGLLKSQLLFVSKPLAVLTAIRHALYAIFTA